MTDASSTGRPRLLVVGLDGVPPEFLFERFLPQMPNVRRLVEGGTHGSLRSTDPPISVPAWPVMFTGVDPGTLGLYGFRHRRPGSYTEMHIPSARDLPVPTLWQLLSERGYRVGVVGMPPGYPAPAVNGVYVSDFLTPSNATDSTHPPELREEIERRFGPYAFDVTFRSAERDQLALDLFAMTRRRFEVAEWLYGQEPWDVFAVHVIGTDRLHHAYWKYFDPTHPRFEAGSRFGRIADDFYALVDEGIGRLLAHVDARTYVLIVSDHGNMAMRGCFCINQWLESAGYLTMRTPPTEPGTPIEKADVDWTRTTVWGAGGYYARIFFNIVGRETGGTVTLPDVPALRAALVEQLAKVADPAGGHLRVQVLDPQEIYATVRGDAPDLIVYFDDLRIRAAGTVGHPSLFLQGNDTGPDDAVHSFDGVFLLSGPGVPTRRTLPKELQIRDVMPTILELLGEPVPAYVQGRPIGGLSRGRTGVSVAATPAGT